MFIITKQNWILKFILFSSSDKCLYYTMYIFVMYSSKIWNPQIHSITLVKGMKGEILNTSKVKINRDNGFKETKKVSQ